MEGLVFFLRDGGRKVEKAICQLNHAPNFDYFTPGHCVNFMDVYEILAVVIAHDQK